MTSTSVILSKKVVNHDISIKERCEYHLTKGNNTCINDF